MSGYGDIKTRKFLRVLNWLRNGKPVTVEKGGRHNIKVICIHNGQSFPLPTSHPEINKRLSHWAPRQTRMSGDSRAWRRTSALAVNGRKIHCNREFDHGIGELDLGIGQGDKSSLPQTVKGIVHGGGDWFEDDRCTIV